jgi:hypothetical protein
MNYKLFKFAEKLADLMEKHGVCLTSTLHEGRSMTFASIRFQAEGNKHIFPNMKRCHVSPYDIRTECLGMTSKEANSIYEKRKDKKS